MQTKQKHSLGLVLSGGGARGAYEAGVLAYILKHVGPLRHSKRRFDVISGTSVGGVHACFLTACAHLPEANIDSLLQVWRSFKLQHMLQLSLWQCAQVPWQIYRMYRPNGAPRGLFLNTEALHDVVMKEIPWVNLRSNLQDGLIHSLTLSATHVYSGKTVVFVDCPRGGVPPWTRDYRRLAVATEVTGLHALASASIPLIFPSINIGGSFYCDGGLRQNTPLSPALRCGANRVLVISVGHGQQPDPNALDPFQGISPSVPTRLEVYPKPEVMLGKVFNALLLDHLDYDLAQLAGINRLLKDGENTFGDNFISQIASSAQAMRGQTYRHVDTLVIRPSLDLGEVANDFVRTHRKRFSGIMRRLLDNLSGVDHTAPNADFLSYLLFDTYFTERLIDLGIQDAKNMHDHLEEFFKDAHL